MPKKLLVVLLVAIALFSLTISAVPVSAAGISVTPAAVSPLNAASNQILVDDDDNGKTVTMLVADRLVLSLNYIGGAPLAWEIAQIDDSSFQLMDNYQIPSSTPGGVGTEVWVFKATSVGNSPLLMEYRELDGTVAGTFDVTVKVGAVLQAPVSSNVAIGILVAGLTVCIAWLSLKKARHSQI